MGATSVPVRTAFPTCQRSTSGVETLGQDSKAIQMLLLKDWAELREAAMPWGHLNCQEATVLCWVLAHQQCSVTWKLGTMDGR